MIERQFLMKLPSLIRRKVMKGKLIVFEGIDGSGKETQASLLENKLKQQGKEVMHISFPDCGPIYHQ